MSSRRDVPFRLTSCVVALALLGAACSGGDEEGATIEAADEPTPTPLAAQDPGDDAAEGADDTGTEAGDDTTGDDTGTVDVPGDEPADPAAEPTPPRDVDLSTPAFTERSKISTVGLDEVFFGMTAGEAAAAADTEWESDGPTTSECWFATPVNGPVGVAFMIWNGSVERVDITTELITTRSGAGVGSTPDELRTLFGDLLDQSDPVLLAFVPADEGDADFRIFFEITDGAVSSYRAGRLPMVEFPTCP